MSDSKKSNEKICRRKFLASAAKGAGLAFAAASCDPGTYFDYMEGDDVDRVTDRYHESTSGHARPLTFPTFTSPQFSFLWTSDIHITEGKSHHMDKLGAYAEQNKVDFVLHSGDCADDGMEAEFDKWVRVMDQYLPVPVYTAIGNHDLYGDGWDLYKKYIGPSVYRFEYGQCDFTFIDCANGTLGMDQMNWLERVLKAGKDKRCRFVLGHYPIYEGTIQTPSAMGNTQERMKLIWLFDEYNVDYHLSGHKHVVDINKLRSTNYLIGGFGSSYKSLLNDDYGFFHFSINGHEISRKKVHYDDVRII